MQNFVSLSQSDLSGTNVPDTWKITCKYLFVQNPKLRLAALELRSPSCCLRSCCRREFLESINFITHLWRWRGAQKVRLLLSLWELILSFFLREFFRQLLRVLYFLVSFLLIEDGGFGCWSSSDLASTELWSFFIFFMEVLVGWLPRR
jgi:hypothetical protein